MKKMMIVLAAITMAIVANAGAVKWQCYDIGTDDNGEYDMALAYLILSDSSALDNTAYVDALKGQTFTGAGEAGYVDWTEIGATVGNYQNTTVYGYMILLDSDNLSTYENFKISDVISATFGASGDNPLNFTDSIASTSWIPVGGEAIPEPTSALMLLVGLAGLALKRKVA